MVMARPLQRDRDAVASAPGTATRSVAELRAEIDALRDTCRLKEQYLSVASHELSAPLAAMKAYIEALLDHHAEPGFTQTGEFLAILGRETDRLIRLVDRTLEISRLTTRDGLQKEPVDLEDLLAEMLPPLQPSLEERGARLAVQLAPGLAPVCADRDLLLQVLLNLIHNALKFSPRGSTVVVAAVPAGSGVQIEVRDQGYGIGPDELENVFEPYFRSSDERVERERGTGLGLSIVKTIVQQHGGRIGVESAPDRGTVFRFDIPAI
jgi:two-component system phosphate regulon sensor histidine kinase PhoR